MYLDYPARVPLPETPTGVFMFDDGGETDFTEAFPCLSGYGYPATPYVNTADISTRRKLSESQLADLAAGGWLVGSHTATHPNLRDLDDPAAIRSEVGDAREWLTERGCTDGASHFAYPYDAVDEQALRIVSEFHSTGRAGGWQPVPLPSSPQLIPGAGGPEPGEATRLLDQAVRYGGVVCFFFHYLDGDPLERVRRVVDEVHRREREGELQVVRVDELEAMAGRATDHG
jgi:peptidoglycan/xylan/chitin deacetylase (PgdA/CDA1 family)